MKAKINFYLTNTLKKAPSRQTAGASGYDVYCPTLTHLPPQRITRVPLGFSMEFPRGLDCTLRGRSGLASKGILGLLGTIDSDYRGEVCILIWNTTMDDHYFHPGDRIGQLVFLSLEVPIITAETSLSATARGTGGFGSTGGFPDTDGNKNRLSDHDEL